ncbi:MAG: hypothetical protein U5K84_02595 [Alkalibacterium sp.]|nr:hypothetical protein [Alkalibacterium sp.]
MHSFSGFVDIRTQFTSILPVFLGVAFSIHYFEAFDLLKYSVIFIVAAALLDFTTTAINVLIDYRTASSEESKRTGNIIGRENIPEKLIVNYIFGMLLGSFLLGLILVFRTNIVLLFIGLVCFIIWALHTPMAPYLYHACRWANCCQVRLWDKEEMFVTSVKAFWA